MRPLKISISIVPLLGMGHKAKLVKIQLLYLHNPHDRYIFPTEPRIIDSLLYRLVSDEHYVPT